MSRPLNVDATPIGDEFISMAGWVNVCLWVGRREYDLSSGGACSAATLIGRSSCHICRMFTLPSTVSYHPTCAEDSLSRILFRGFSFSSLRLSVIMSFGLVPRTALASSCATILNSSCPLAKAVLSNPFARAAQRARLFSVARKPEDLAQIRAINSLETIR